MTADVRFDPTFLPDLVGSAFDALEDHRFQAHGRDDRAISQGVELELLRAIFGRAAAWFAAGAEPCIINIKQGRLREFVPELLDAESELSHVLVKAKQKRFTDIAYAWNAAFEDGPRFLAARPGEPPNYAVRMWVRNGGGMLRFWLDVERRTDDGGVVPVFATARSRSKPLAKVLNETADSPPLGRYWQAIKDAADRGDPQARSIIEDARHYLFKTLKVIVWAAIIGGVTYPFLPEPAQAAVRDAMHSVVEIVKKVVPFQPDTPPSPPPQPQAQPQRPPSRSSPAPAAGPVVHTLAPMHVTVLPPANRYLYTPSAAHDAVDIYATAPAYEEQNVRVTAEPSLVRLGRIEGSVKVDFGDGSSATAPVRAQSQPNLRPAATLLHVYKTGDRLYKLRAEVRALMPEGGTRIVEIIEREIYVFKTKSANEPLVYESPVPEHEFDGGMWYAEPDDPRAIEYIVTTAEGTTRERRRPGRTE